jgi:prephenate dehydrogenase
VDVAFLGLGQIGGSIARAVAGTAGVGRVTAWTPSGRGPAAAARDTGIVAAPSLAEAVGGADLVVLAAPPIACLDLIDVLAGEARQFLAADAVVTDVASTKDVLVARAADRGLRFVGGHPMTGRESSGWSASDPELLRDRPWVIVPPEPDDPDAVARVERLVAACGSRPVRLSASAHDAAVAAISHVPLVVSAALVDAMTAEHSWPLARELSAGGWASMTRLAGGDPAMGGGIVATNALAVAEGLRRVQRAIATWLEAIERSAGARTPLAHVPPDAAIPDSAAAAITATSPAAAGDSPATAAELLERRFEASRDRARS